MSKELPFWPSIGETPTLSVLVLGTCNIGALVTSAGRASIRVDHYIFESYTHSPIPECDLAGYDAIVVALTLRHILIEATGKSTSEADMVFVRMRNKDEADALFERATSILRQRLASLHEELGRRPTFFLSLLLPSFNYLGALVGRDDPTSAVSIISRINAELAEIISKFSNFYLVDVNEVANWIGRAHLQDDVINTASHASLIADRRDVDENRLMPPSDVFETYDTLAVGQSFGLTLWRSISENLRVLAQDRSIKLIVVDLDDTLWRGVAAEDSLANHERVEGWPLGFVEALLYYRKRGGLLAICSKNDEETTLPRIYQIFDRAISAEDFASIKINWSSKADNIQAILAEVNLLPRNVMFIDDNPRELDEVVARFPDMLCYRGSHYDWRRLILRAPEFQVPFITKESESRTELTRARVERDREAQSMDRAEWLRSLHIRVGLQSIHSHEGVLGRRALELINKTNQFNTTGRRWSAEEFASFFSEDGVGLLASLKDKMVDNGIIGVVLVKAGHIEQAVLSCRVFGLGAEIAMGAAATELAIAQAGSATSRIVDTGRNFTCHKYFELLGFELSEGEFRATHPCSHPDWIQVVSGALDQRTDREPHLQAEKG